MSNFLLWWEQLKADFITCFVTKERWRYITRGLGNTLKIALVAAAVIGHILPLFAGFRGGKGVAPLAGAVLAVYPSAVLLCLLIFGIVFVTTHYVSLGSISAGIAFPIFVIGVFGERSVSLIVFSCVIAVLLLYTHRRNIQRLFDHSESKTYLFKKKDKK